MFNTPESAAALARTITDATSRADPTDLIPGVVDEIVLVDGAPMLMKLIRAAYAADPVVAEGYGNLLADRMDEAGLTGRFVRQMLEVLRGDRKEQFVHAVSATDPTITRIDFAPGHEDAPLTSAQVAALMRKVRLAPRMLKALKAYVRAVAVDGGSDKAAVMAAIRAADNEARAVIAEAEGTTSQGARG